MEMAGFEVIPVIDLKGGKAVRAAGGDRARYRPLASPLCADGAPLNAAKGLLALHPFRRLYLADLDAIEGRAPQTEAIRALRSAYPDLELWVDCGLPDEAACRDWLALGLGRPVLGSESLRDAALARRMNGVLSLDFRQGRLLGPPALLSDAALWPSTLIVMSLTDVGAASGPDLPLLREIRARAGRRRVYAAGGVRSAADLEALAQAGAAGALIATALHEGGIAGEELARFAAE
jgi:phosphoribosylformimino-5-aminoimidazole carboxamide ribotide isomerase